MAAREQLSKLPSEEDIDPKFLVEIEKFIEARIQSVCP
jgi:hypothetical protein